jgi:hypothetical protein
LGYRDAGQALSISLIGVASGFVVLFGLLKSRRLDGWTKIFLWTTAVTSVTGFLFPFEKFLPSQGFGILSLILLVFAILARYRFLCGNRINRALSECLCVPLEKQECSVPFGTTRH